MSRGIGQRFSASATALASLAGSLYAYFFHFLSPDMVNIQRSFDMITMMILGGEATLVGSVFGSAVLTMLPIVFQPACAVQDFLRRAAAGAGVPVYAGWSLRSNSQYVIGSQKACVRAGLGRTGGGKGWAMSQSALSVRGVSKAFLGLQAVADVTFDVQEGALTALIGPNGAGKTTLFNIVTQLYKPDTGHVELFGMAIDDKSSQEIAQMGMIRTFQTARVFPTMTPWKMFWWAHTLKVKSAAYKQMLWLPSARSEEAAILRKGEALLDLVGLSAFAMSPQETCPMGAQKLLEVIRAMMSHPACCCLTSLRPG